LKKLEVLRKIVHCLKYNKPELPLLKSKIKDNSYRAVNTLLGYRDQKLMLYGERIAVCSQIRKKHTNTPRGQNVEFLNVIPGDM
jgi:hypothetical protein